jgi:ribonuclease D
MTCQWIDSDRELGNFLAREPAGRYALDTEFHRERTYWPQLALVQLRIGEHISLIDPLRCDVTRLSPLFSSDAVCVLHAGTQDLEILGRACGAVPRRLYDTQIAAGFLGFSQVSLSALVYDVRKVSLPKSDRLTDWLRRPLSPTQVDYAASDVEHLFEIHDHQLEALERLGRVGWAEEAFHNLLQKSSTEHNLDDAWLKVKDVRALRGEARGVARSLARWREERAMRLDIPVRRVLSDMALVSIAQAKPSSPGQLHACRGIDSRQLGGEMTAELLQAVERGTGQEVTTPETRRVEVDSKDRAVVPLIAAWVAERARKADLDPVFLATRQDIDEFLAGISSCRLREGWRAELLLTDLEHLRAGKKGLGVDGAGRLILVDIEPQRG